MSAATAENQVQLEPASDLSSVETIPPETEKQSSNTQAKRETSVLLRILEKASTLVFQSEAEAAEEDTLTEEATSGILRIHSQPEGAEVMVDGVYRGTTPLVLSQVLVGSHQVLIQKDGYQPAEHEIVCTRNASSTFNLCLEMSPQLDIPQGPAADGSYAKIGNYSDAAPACEGTFPVHPKAPAGKQPLLDKEVNDLLLSVKTAVESENMESFLTLLDDTEPGFVRRQKAKAERLFSEFDKINGKYSRVNVEILDDNRLAVRLHCRVKAAFAKTGRSVVLFDGDQTLTLKKMAGAMWKICAVE